MPHVEAVRSTFVRYALPITWDYSETCPIGEKRGGWSMCIDTIVDSLRFVQKSTELSKITPRIVQRSAIIGD